MLCDKHTTKLWPQYLEMVEILLAFIKSDRTGNWQPHLEMGQSMLLFLAAAGHNNYAKPMLLLCWRHTRRFYRHFEEGYHVISRNDRYWAGLSAVMNV